MKRHFCCAWHCIKPAERLWWLPPTGVLLPRLPAWPESLLLSHYSCCGPHVMVSSHQTDSCQSLEASLKCQLPCEDSLIWLLLRTGFSLQRKRRHRWELFWSVEKSDCFLSPEEAATRRSRARDQWRCCCFFSEPRGHTVALQQGPVGLAMSFSPLLSVCARLCQPTSVDELSPPSVPGWPPFSYSLLTCSAASSLETLFGNYTD